MSRQLRIAHSNAWYHVMNRGAGHKIIFPSVELRGIFFDLLKQIHQKYKVEIHGYCLMDNHYHLLIHTPQPNISEAMRHLNSLYTRKYNLFMEIDGPLFRGRFKSNLIENDQYFLQVSRYIHLNPSAAGLDDELSNCLRSSLPYFIDPNLNPPVWLITDEVLGQFGISQEKYENYRIFMMDDPNTMVNLHKLGQGLLDIPIFGSEDFIFEKAALATENGNIINKEISNRKNIKDLFSPSFDAIDSEVIKFYKISKNFLFCQRLPSKKFNLPRSTAIYISIEVAGYNLSSAAKHYKLTSYSGISQNISRFKKRLLHEAELRSSIEFIVNKLKFSETSDCC